MRHFHAQMTWNMPMDTSAHVDNESGINFKDKMLIPAHNTLLS